jgi:polyisoprenoid-binding protein YceI
MRRRTAMSAWQMVLRLVLLALPALALWFAWPAEAALRRYALDGADSRFDFHIGYLGFARVDGRFHEAQGEFTFDAETGVVANVRIMIGTASVDTGHARRDAHLRSADFFWAERYPFMVFEGVRVERLGERMGAIDGVLTLRGVTRPLRLTLRLDNDAGSDRLFIHASGALRRSDYGMRYGLAELFIKDQVILDLKVAGAPVLND